jgi:guanylate kinase
MADFKGKCIIVSAPSGAGKTTIVKHLLKSIPSLAFSVSATSRPPRSNEVDGKDYHFLSEDDFRKRIQANEFLEWEEVYPGRFYGTLKSEENRLWGEGKHIVFDLDVEGGVNLKAYFGSAALALFIQPPSLEALAERLRNRSTETEDTLAVRLSKASSELKFAGQFDKIIINDNLEEACRQSEIWIKEFLKT